MERNRFKYCELNAYYGGLLTKRQSEIFTLHYEEDLSLSEISERLNITRQAVLDNLRHAENTLANAEDVIKLVERDNKLRKQIILLEEAVKNENKMKIQQIFSHIKKLMED